MGCTRGYFSLVLRQNLFLHGIGERVDRVAGFCFSWHPADRELVPANLHDPLRSGEDQAFALISTIDKVDAQARLNPWG